MIKILHTADWHIGQLFFGYDRSYEHQQFLNWLVDTLYKEKIDVLLISGDVFDLSNPSATAVKMFYSFLNQATKQSPALQIIITAGNHDSASRLESPKPLIESSNIHIVGLVEKDEAGAIDYAKVVIPLKNNEGATCAWCIAAPFLRMGDYPVLADCDNAYVEGVAAFYKEAYEFISSTVSEDLPVIAMGHLHAQHAEVGDIDKLERPIMGGVECISASAFHESICYVALGHIHKAQRIGGKEHIRYCGSPLPMSFSEINYKHQVVVFDLENETVTNLKTMEIPLSVPLKQVPSMPGSLLEVLGALSQLPAAEGNLSIAPYLEVRVLLDGPEPGLRKQIETVIADKYVRLAKIDARYKTASASATEIASTGAAQLNDLQPLDVLEKVYQSKYQNPVPEALVKLFQQASQEANQSEA
jgi:exonuclease SbcD